MNSNRWWVWLLVLLTWLSAAEGARKVISLDGTWEVAEGAADAMPTAFEHEVVVPGLVDMARPAFDDVGKVSDKRQAFWYRRTFAVEGEIADVAMLKVHKAKYCTKVWLNGEVVGEHSACFTPGYFDVKGKLKGGGLENELVIRVGANRESVPAGQPSGWDFEKYLYIPGIYDSVELILTGSPHIVNVQTVPDIEAGEVKVVVELGSDERARTAVQCRVSQAKSGKSVGSAKSQRVRLDGGEVTKVEVTVAIEDCRLWSPEDPFLYEVEVGAGDDVVKHRFGMRSFRFDAESGRAVLNGKPYMMRGTNVCVYRFFEDSERGDKPWRAEWVRRLHRKFKSMGWNSIRYCIGFPPELWYEIADEEGFLIQDEFPIWLLGEAPEDPRAEKIVPEYTEWMRERWNHASVVIWDAQNESKTEETGKALQAVRGLDLSDRPWENGWAAPQSVQDFVESHPYLFIKAWTGNEGFKLKDMVGVSGAPYRQDAQKKLKVPILINEYGWLWLNRDGTPTTLTKKIYESLGLWPGSSAGERFEVYAKYLAALTEFWRAHRECAGVMHFCGLGYCRTGFEDRPLGGATSDHFIDLEKLTFEPMFERYVRDAFSPVGVMVDFWDDQIEAGAKRQLKVYVINDLPAGWSGAVRLKVLAGDKVVSQQERRCSVESLGREIVEFEFVAPKQSGEYTLVAELVARSMEPVCSVRDFKVP